MKRTLAIIALILLSVSTGFTEPQVGRVITITAGTAIRVILNASQANPVKANSMLIQPLHGASADLIYVLNANPSVTCANGGAGTTFIAELGAATATTPGQSFTFPSNNTATSSSSGFDVRYFCLDGAHSGDTVAVSWDVRQ